MMQTECWEVAAQPKTYFQVSFVSRQSYVGSFHEKNMGINDAGLFWVNVIKVWVHLHDFSPFPFLLDVSLLHQGHLRIHTFENG